MQTHKTIIGNWKMEVADTDTATSIAEAIADATGDITKTVFAVCPSMVHLSAIRAVAPNLALGAQDCALADAGAYTGQTSAAQLQNLGIMYVILGHSERRALGETSAVVNEKIKRALAAGLTPVVCVGEPDREGGDYIAWVQEQVRDTLAGLGTAEVEKIILAYEPIWAIGATAKRASTPTECQEMMQALRQMLLDDFDVPPGQVPVIYGGSANRDNAAGFLTDGEADGLLPGRASVDPEHFVDMVRIAEAL